MEIFVFAVVVGVAGSLAAFWIGFETGLVFIGVYLASLVVGGWVLTFWARRHLVMVLSAPVGVVADAVQQHFKGAGWRAVKGEGAFNYQSRGIGLGAYGAENPVVSIELEDLHDGTTGVEVWMSEWMSRIRIAASCDRVVSEKWWLARKLARARVMSMLAVAAAVTALQTGYGPGPGTALAQDSCASVVVYGAPGSNQGRQHNPGKSDGKSVLGTEVNTVVDVLSSKILDIAVVGIDYPARGVDGTGPVDAKLLYNFSEYKRSKDTGYSASYQGLSKYAARCRSSKFVLVGYSQGAHIMGDLAQSVFHGNGPVGKSRIAAVVLIADPAFNGPSPRSTEIIYVDGKVSHDENHWSIGGALGQRAKFSESDPVISVCIYGDPICDGASIGLNGLNGLEADKKKWMHALYTGIPYEGAKDIATWAGRAAAELARR
ncbi:cutinase family protein [Nocardia amamiensis]|uniref:cutinase family protein n=1 Tax=Nocardia TaxID=1817 RepID=UPI0033F4FE83